MREARERLDAWTREMMEWHFNPETGCPFLVWSARNRSPSILVATLTSTTISTFSATSRMSGCAAVRSGAGFRKGLAGKPIYVFETGGSTGVPKSRIASEDFRIDYELFSDTLPDDAFPKGANWISIGPTGPRRLRLAVEHLAQYRGGICFHLDLDPRWVIKLIKMGEMRMMEFYKQHVIDQALTLLKAHDIQCIFTTPKLLEALCEKISLKKAGIKGVFCGGTEMTPQFHRFAVEELLDGIYFAPTYGNTLMGLAVHKPRVPGRQLGHHLLPAIPASHDRSGRLRRCDETGRLWRNRPRSPDDTDP